MNKYIEELRNTFFENRKLTYSLIDHLTEDQLVEKIKRPGLDSVSKQIQEMADVQIAFVKSIASGEIDFSTVTGIFDYTSINSKEKLVECLKSADKFTEIVFQSGQFKESIDWHGKQINICSHLNSLICHEVFHQGQIVMALYWMDIEMPETWCHTWALPSTCKHQ